MELLSLWIGGVVGAIVLVLILEVLRGRQAARAVPDVVQDPPQTCPGCEEVSLGLGQLQQEFQALRAAVAEGIEHVDRVENRIRGTIKRARKELSERGLESPGLDAEVATLSLVDDQGGGAEAVPVVPAGVGEPQSSVPGVTPEQLRRVRGI